MMARRLDQLLCSRTPRGSSSAWSGGAATDVLSAALLDQPEPFDGRVKWWAGAGWRAKPLKRWTGSAWEVVNPKWWANEAWHPLPPPEPPVGYMLGLLHADEITFGGPNAATLLNSAGPAAFRRMGDTKGWFEGDLGSANRVHFENDNSGIVTQDRYLWDGDFGIDFRLFARGTDTYPYVFYITTGDPAQPLLFGVIIPEGSSGGNDQARIEIYGQTSSADQTMLLSTSTIIIRKNSATSDHLVVQRRSGTLEVGFNGELVGSAAHARAYDGYLAIGCAYEKSGSTESLLDRNLLADLDEICVRMGEPAVSAFPYVVPTAPYSAGASPL